MNYVLRLSLLAAVTVAIVAVASYFFTTNKLQTAEAANPPQLTGYAWASADPWDGTPPAPPIETGVGWISLNCVDGGDSPPPGNNICSTSNYGVTVNSDKTLSGYAWAGGDVSNGVDSPFGWISFNDNGCPSNDSDGLNCQPHIIRNSGDNGWELDGWARACAVFSNTNGCSGALKTPAELGGWDGWISLNCKNTNSCSGAGSSNYTIRIDENGVVDPATNGSGSFAWGGNITMGWVNFGQMSVNACTFTETYTCEDLDFNGTDETSRRTSTDLWCGPDTTNDLPCNVGETCVTNSTRCTSAPPTGSLTLSPTVVRAGSSVTATWSSTVATGCSLTVGGLSIALNGLSGNEPFTAPNNQTTVVLTCNGVDVATAVLNVIPSLYES